jgi:hypothetical protein
LTERGPAVHVPCGIGPFLDQERRLRRRGPALAPAFASPKARPTRAGPTAQPDRSTSALRHASVYWRAVPSPSPAALSSSWPPRHGMRRSGHQEPRKPLVSLPAHASGRKARHKSGQRQTSLPSALSSSRCRITRSPGFEGGTGVVSGVPVSEVAQLCWGIQPSDAHVRSQRGLS